jgi:hypothetical protein
MWMAPNGGIYLVVFRECHCFPFLSQDFPKDRAQETTQLAKFQAFILTLDALANNWLHVHVYYKPLPESFPL